MLPLACHCDGRAVTYGWGEPATLVPEPGAHGHHPRGNRLVVLVGQKKALVIVLKNQLGRRRTTKPAAWLKAAG